MEKLQIHSLDSVWTICDQKTAILINRELSYEQTAWVQTFRGKKQVKSRKYLVDARGDDHYFHTGFVPRVLKYIKKEGYSVKYTSDIPLVEHDDPKIKGIKFRSFQAKAFKDVLKVGRGVIKAPTGSGKTAVIGGLVSCFSEENILILIHTNDLVTQTIEELNSFGFYSTEYSGKKKKISRITVATIQSFKNVVQNHLSFFDCVIVDEVHHISSFSGSYAKVLSMLSAPVKLGTTATLPYKEEAKFALEGFIGPVISEYKISDAQKDGILAVPKIIIHKTEKVNPKILNSSVGVNSKNGTEPTRYRKHYFNGIANNINRNYLISKIASGYTSKGKSVLISIVLISHGKKLKEMIPNSKFIHGGTPKDEREKIKKNLNNKKIKCVIASVAWTEGIDIPSLDVCILAGGGKSDIKVIQGVGRGLRKTKSKNKVIIVDFDDSLISKYLKKHSNDRFKIYKKMDWL